MTDLTESPRDTLRNRIMDVVGRTRSNSHEVRDESIADEVMKILIQRDLENGTKIEFHPPEFYETLESVAGELVETLKHKGGQYGNSWISRGGVGAFMMLTRKWDRIVNQLKKDPQFDIIKHAEADTREEGLRDDIEDLVAYLLLVLTWLSFKRG